MAVAGKVSPVIRFDAHNGSYWTEKAQTPVPEYTVYLEFNRRPVGSSYSTWVLCRRASGGSCRRWETYGETDEARTRSRANSLWTSIVREGKRP